MITEIKIDNFRCFNQSKFEGFQRINLIGGKNNSGKTALLEAIYLNASPKGKNVIELLNNRQITLEFIQELENKAWNNFFLNPQKGMCRIIAKLLNEDERNLILQVENSFYNSNINENLYYRLENLLRNKSTLILFLKLLFNSKEISSSFLTINQNEFFTENLEEEVKSPEVVYISASLKIDNKTLATDFSRTQLNNLEDKVLKAFQIIDPSIENLKILSIGQPTIYIKQKDKEYLPIGLFGDAINKVSYLILRLLNSPKGILLIDEIENGIHYSNQEQLWQFLFELAELLDVQIFATTHSIEMITAFNKVIEKKAFSGKGNYFELIRHRKTGEITATKHTSKALNFEIENELSIRG